MIKPYQTGLLPLGHFDFKDDEIANIKGGEVAVFATAESTDDSVPDVFGGPPRSLLRLATSTDVGPFFFVDADINEGALSAVNLESSSMFSTAASYTGTSNVAGKLAIFAAEGFYAITTDAVDTTTINANTAPNTRLYVDSDGKLTAKESSPAVIAGFFIEHRDVTVTSGFPQRFNVAGSNRLLSTVIVYKANADGYLNLEVEAIAQAVGSQGTIGTPTDGYYTDGYVNTLTAATTIADGIDSLNEALLGVFHVAQRSGTLGIPDDGLYTDGLFPFTADTSTANAVDDINELLLAIAPAQPGDLTSQSLVLSGSTTYSAILPSGLAAAWYVGGDVAGGTITTYIVDGTYTLDSPDQSTRFNGGRIADTSLLGIITHVLNGADGSAHDAATNGVGTTGTVTVDDISTYNTIWNKINAQIDYTQVAEGRITHAMSHTLAGTSNTTELFYDDTNTAPTFSSGLSVAENVVLDGYLSGIRHYAVNASFTGDFTAASGIFEKAYHPTRVAELTGPAMSAVQVNPSSTPAVGDTFVVSGEGFSLDTASVVRETHAVTCTLRKPNGDSATSTANLSLPVNTYSTTTATTTAEYFVDESRRLTALASTAPDWTSSDALTDGYAQQKIVGSVARVQFPDSTDYSGFVGAEQLYQRHFSKTAASSGTIVFTGISYTDIDSYDSGGDLNVLLYLDTDQKWFDLGRVFGDDGLGDGSGDSQTNAIGARTSGSSGTVDFTFTTYSTGDNSNRYRIYIVFRNTNHTITQIVTS